MPKDRVIRFRVDDPLWDFWSRIPDGYRSIEGRKWFGYWMTTAGEDGLEKWEKVLKEHEPYVSLARQKIAEYQERERAAIADADAEKQRKEDAMKKLMEMFSRYGWRVKDVPPSIVKNYVELLGLSPEEIRKLLTDEAKKKGMA